MGTIQEIREETFRDLEMKLLTNGRCMVVRPTGFGKTFMVSRLIKQYEKVLFLYPTNVIADAVFERNKDAKNIDYLSYQGLVSSKAGMLDDYDLVICDECHRVGATSTRVALKEYLETHKRTKLIGLTATPQRTDMLDILEDMFGGIQVFPYTLHQAIQDGNIVKPYYCFMSYGVTKEIEDSINKGMTAIDAYINSEVKKNLARKKLTEMCSIYNVDKVIRNTCDKYLDSTDYMKFIWFFPTMKSLNLQKDTVVENFQKAYPTHEVRTLVVMSDYDNQKNLQKLNEFKRTSKTIDLIFSIDMLNMGYHVDDITGVGMNRATDSSIIYLQQFGRCTSTKDVSSEPKIIFDLVDNLSRNSCYGEDTRTDIEEKELEGINILTRQDIVAVGNIADYKLLLKKIELEPRTVLCKHAYKYFQEHSDTDTLDSVAEKYGITKEDIILTKDKKSLVKANKGGTEKPKRKPRQNAPRYHIGEVRTMNLGLKASCIEYISATDMVRIMFEDGNVTDYRTMNAFRKGKVCHPGIKSYGGKYYIRSTGERARNIYANQVTHRCYATVLRNGSYVDVEL